MIGLGRDTLMAAAANHLGHCFDRGRCQLFPGAKRHAKLRKPNLVRETSGLMEATAKQGQTPAFPYCPNAVCYLNIRTVRPCTRIVSSTVRQTWWHKMPCFQERLAPVLKEGGRCGHYDMMRIPGGPKAIEGAASATARGLSA